MTSFLVVRSFEPNCFQYTTPLGPANGAKLARSGQDYLNYALHSVAGESFVKCWWLEDLQKQLPQQQIKGPEPSKIYESEWNQAPRSER